MKKQLTISACVMLCFGVMICGVAQFMGGCGNVQTPAPAAEPSAEAQPAAASGSYTPGTYSASEMGFAGNVTVTITAAADKITDVVIEGPDETPDKGGVAMEQLKPLLLEAQSDQVDAVSGATITSDAVKKAFAAALEQAKSGSAPAADAGAEAEAAALSFTAGKYTGKGDGYNGPVELLVTFDDSKITDIEIVTSTETGEVGTPAYDIMFPQIIEANGTGVDAVSGATFTSRAIKTAVNDAADQAGVSDKTAFTSNKIEVTAQAPIEETVDVVVVGGGGAGISAAAQAAQDGNSVIVLEKNAQVGGNTLVSGGQYQSVMKYLVWDPADPDATTGKGYDGKTYDKVKSVKGCIDELKRIYDWNEDEFDADYYKTHEFVAGDVEELHKHGVHKEYLPILKELKAEIKEYLDWAEPQLKKGTPESELTLFSTVNLHIFQTYYGGLRMTADKSQWIYGDVDLVKQFIEDAQDIKPWLQSMGSTFKDDEQQTLIGALWYRENEFIGSNVDFDKDGKPEEYGGRWGTYFMAPMNEMLNTSNPDGKNQIITRTTVTELIQEGGKITGVKGEMYDGTPVTVHADKGVILATGGFAANIDKVLQYNEYWDSKYLTKDTKTTNRSSMVGSGIDMAEKVGAEVTGMNFTQLMPISWVDNGNLAFGGGNYACWINPTTGKRFVDEGSERDVLSLAEFENGIVKNNTPGVFIEIYNAEQPVPGPPTAQLLPEDYPGRYYHIKGTVDELTKLFADPEFAGVTADPATVLETVKNYDMAVMGKGEFPDCGKGIASRTVGNVEKKDDGSYDVDTYDLEGTTLIVRLMAPSTHHTMGGLKVDVDRHVLDKSGKAIPGLYAAGEVTGGIHGGNRLGGNAIAEIIVSGRTAAKAVTKDN